MSATIKAVNKALALLSVELVKGKGYFYFVGTNGSLFVSGGVYVNSVKQLTVAQWVKEAKTMMGSHGYTEKDYAHKT